MRTFEHIPTIATPCCLAIGFFDGMHLGHQALLERLTSVADEKGYQNILISFRNHPRTVLKPDTRLELITPLNQRLNFFKIAGIENLLLLPFTTEFSKQTAEQFLDTITQKINLKHLVLGHDTHIGYERKGNREIVEAYAKEHAITVEYLDPLHIGKTLVSSSKVKNAIHAGDFDTLKTLLKRPYSLMLPVQKGQGIGKTMGFATANLPLDRLCLPPRGVYSVIVNKTLPAIANLGVAPTLRSDPSPQLEVHILDECPDLSDQILEVEFVQFIRPEERFENKEALQKQISKDIITARTHLSAK